MTYAFRRGKVRTNAVANLSAAALSGAPGVKILATSREPLGVTGERDYRLAA